METLILIVKVIAVAVLVGFGIGIIGLFTLVAASVITGEFSTNLEDDL